MAAEDTDIPFDIAQNVSRHAAGAGVRAWLADQVHGAIYSVQSKASRDAGLVRTLAYAERVAAADSDNLMLGVGLKMLRAAGDDAIRFRDALSNFNTRLGAGEHEIVQSRWPPHYPDPHGPRNFAVMPFPSGARARLRRHRGLCPPRRR